MLYDALLDVVERFPQHIALVEGDSSITYELLWQRIKRVSGQLSMLGVREGDRVCLLSENSIDAVTVYWAVLNCNAIGVYLNEQTPADGLLKIIDDAAPSLLIVTEKLMARKGAEIVKGLKIIPMQELISSALGCNITAVADRQKKGTDIGSIATIVYTSGSTGKPKGVGLTHGNLLSVAKMAADGYRTVASDSYMMVVPLHYIHGLMILMTMHLTGASIHFMNSFVFPKMIIRKLKETGVTGFSGVPYHFNALIERGGFLEADLPDLRWIGVTGGTCAKDRLQQISEAHPDLEIHISYGQTECSPRITALNPRKIPHKADSVGQVAAGLLLEFLDDEGNCVPPGELGELVVSGPNVMHGYWNDPSATARVIDAQGRLHTGDLGYMDSEGDVFIKGRLQAMIKSAGERIFPEELEAILSSCPVVLDVAVVGVADELYGQRVEAHVILNPDSDASLESARKYCLEHTAFSRSPKHYHRWQSFPLKANGKTDKQQLIRLVDGKSDTDPAKDGKAHDR